MLVRVDHVSSLIRFDPSQDNMSVTRLHSPAM